MQNKVYPSHNNEIYNSNSHFFVAIIVFELAMNDTVLVLVIQEEKWQRYYMLLPWSSKESHSTGSVFLGSTLIVSLKGYTNYQYENQ